MAHAKKKEKIILEKSLKRKIVVSEAIIRPTGLIDPIIVLKPVENQVDDILEEVRQRILKDQRVLITTMTKKFAEELDIYFKQINIKSAYIHSDVETLDRLDILSDLRRGRYDVLIGINLLREGLDLPEVSLVAIFDADKEGFLRSKTSLIQIVGRAARHQEGTVIMYGDKITASMQFAIDETNRRRALQIAYNTNHNITPQSTTRSLKTIADDVREDIEKDENYGRAGVVLTNMGFQEKGQHFGTDFNGGEVHDMFDDFKIESSNKNGAGSRQLNRYGVAKYAKNAKGASNSTSVHGDNKSSSKSNKGKQVYDSFELKKQENQEMLRNLMLDRSELAERLQIAVDAMDFEMAAALRDLLDIDIAK
jgi:excinuclease UvrABC helicase subunit UvrB